MNIFLKLFSLQQGANLLQNIDLQTDENNHLPF